MVDPLVVTERWIRERLNLTIDTLEDVRSLALPGSYHEKIAHLGRSLASFTRLKHLDLSRNAVYSLEGLEHLHLLETLNLYYNNIPDLQELYRLRHNSNLKELDLRLNPVTKNEPDYRLFIIHMLVKIRLLDDRQVRDSERKAALMHFDSSQAAEMRHQEVNSQECNGQQQDSIPKHIQSRKELVNSLARPLANIGSDETDQLLDLIAENEERLAPGRMCSSSGKKKQDIMGHQQHHSTPKATKPSAKMHSRSPGKNLTSSTPHYRHHSSTAGGGTARTPHSTPTTDHATPHSMTHHVGGAMSPCGPTVNDKTQLRGLFSILKGQDVVHWESNTTLQSRLVEWLSQQSGGREMRINHDEHVAGEVTAISAKLDQKEAKLRELSEKLREREMEAIVLGQKLQLQAEELAQLQLKQQNNDPTATELLQQAQADLSTLNEHVRNLQRENSSLRVQLSSKERDSGLSLDNQLLDRVQTENKLLRTEVNSLSQQNRQQQEGLTQVQELATMLQESHRSLVATNDHLLKELEEAKRRHKLELQQSHSNYEQLRQTVDLIQET